MLVLPADTPVTTPELSTVATPVDEELQVPPLPVLLKVIVEPTQTEVDPLITGKALTVTA